jgi:Ca2+-binding EF-hand superfamily protein
MDATSSGHVDLEAFYRYFKLERSAFGDRVFSVLDEDGSGTVDFREFVLAVWNMCSMDMTALLRFSFSLFDKAAAGAIQNA